jgi:predicted HTH domain antitoxin
MAILQIPYEEDLLASRDQSREQLEQELRFWLAVKLFEIDRVSLGRASEIAGLPKTVLRDRLSELKIPISNLTTEDMAQELRSLRGSSSLTAAR